MSKPVLHVKDLERVLSVALARHYSGKFPDQDVTVMRLSELNSADHGVELTVGDESARVLVEVQ